LAGDRKKISILLTSLTSGGAEKVISLLLKKLVVDFDVHLILIYDLIHFEIPGEVHTFVLSRKPLNTNFSFLGKFTEAVKGTSRYLGILKRNKIDIAVSFLALPNLMNSLARMKHSKLRTIISERGFPTDNTTSKISYYISKVFYPLLYNRNDKLFSNSVYINQDLAINFKIRIPMEVIYNPIEIPKLKVSPDQLTGDDGLLKIVTVGTLSERKNQKMIIDAVAALNKGYELDIYGNGPLNEELSKRILKKGLSNIVHLRGTVSDIYKYLVQYNCFVLSSKTEGFPNALLEAMAIGLPCISTNCLSGPLELLNGSQDTIFIEDGSFFKGKYGLLINNRDQKGLASALVYFKENPPERRKYGELAMKKALEYDLSTVYRQFKTFITS